MKKLFLITLITLTFTASCYGDNAIVTNKSNEDFIVAGNFDAAPLYLPRNGSLSISFSAQANPRPAFVRPQDLILFGSSDLIENELKRSKTNISRLKQAVNNHLKEHVYYRLIGTGGLRARGPYSFFAGDTITLLNGDTAQVKGSTGFTSPLRLEKVND